MSLLNRIIFFFAANVFIFSLCTANDFLNKEREFEKEQCTEKEEFSETKHEVNINGQSVAYRAVAGNLILKNESCKPYANLFYVSYTREEIANDSDRPITFCFNGGPGSSSVWLQLGVLGPKRVDLHESGDALPPYRLVDNEFSLLDVTDLVFIDPVSTGFSQAIPLEDAKKFHGVKEDIKSIAEFIRQYLSRNKRWDSPKFLVGESYGTTRAAGLASYLHDKYYLYVNGIALISSILNFQTIEFDAGNDLPYLLYLPSYTATAWYHKKLEPQLQANFLETLRQSREFAANEYALALFKGDLLTGQERDRIIAQLAKFTGLSPQYIYQSNLRVEMPRFAKELLRSEKRTVGRFDSRFKGIDSEVVGDRFEYDPSVDAVLGAFTATFNQYLQSDLKWNKEAHYKILTNVFPWDYGISNQYLNVGDNLRSVMTKNPFIRIFVASGYFDLALPFFGTEYTFNHLGLDTSLKNNVMMKTYEAGHMMFNYRPALIQLKKDLSLFYEQTLKYQHKEEGKSNALRR